MMFTLCKTLLTKLNTAVGFVSGFTLLLAGILLFIEVVCRYSGNPTDWIAETSVYLFAGAMLFGAAYTLMRERHVRVELLICRFSPRNQDIFNLITALGGMIFCLVVAAHAWVDLIDVIETGETSATIMRIPLWVTEMPLFIGFSLLVLQFLLMAAERAMSLKNGSPVTTTQNGGIH